MKFAFFFSLVLSLYGLVQAGDLTSHGDITQSSGYTQADNLPWTGLSRRATNGVLEDHGYKVDIWRNRFTVSHPAYIGGFSYLYAMAFSPKLKISTIYMAWTDEEPDHENKLSLTEIYNALAEKEGMKPDEMRWVIFEVVVGDFETDLLIDSIRQNRTLGSLEEVRILPGDKEWDMVAATQYYTNLLQVINKPVQKMLIRSINSGRPWEKVNYVNRIFFSFGPLEPKTPVPGTAAEVSATETKPESDEEEQEAALDALSAEEEAKENAF